MDANPWDTPVSGNVDWSVIFASKACDEQSWWRALVGVELATSKGTRNRLPYGAADCLLSPYQHKYIRLVQPLELVVNCMTAY